MQYKKKGADILPAKEIKKGIYWVGVIDWDKKIGNTIGTSYNSYLIIDDKITLIDAVSKEFTDEMISNIREVVDISKIDNIIINHVEPDHSGAFAKLIEHIPNAKIYCSVKGKEAMKQHYIGNHDYNVVNTGDVLNIGKRSLKFIEAPMLHWPDSMFTYVEEEKLLIPSDLFGQNIASTYLLSVN